jgi:hypothetical protein
MYISSSKKFFLAALLLISAHQSEAKCYFASSFKRTGNEAVTVNGLFTNFVVHPYASRLAKQNLPDAVLFDAGSLQLQAHELWQLLAAMLVEAVNAKLLGATEDQVKRTLKLVVYGAALHKAFVTACKALGLDAYLSNEDKEAYDDYGRGYVQAFFAGALDEYLDPEHYAAMNAKANNNNA